ncbi:hypothetical protein LSTR_LSTR013681 [Laodelphax striatellus]|uniref:C2 domain-containing protein n=1 Tax=Laodelphax striatellus TaxID=195883 RepID=A0A482WXR2_LAOST|nr:hypothetical protein LSTR_LSTR013681 [Laodelphax striatellus]
MDKMKRHTKKSEFQTLDADHWPTDIPVRFAEELPEDSNFCKWTLLTRLPSSSEVFPVARRTTMSSGVKLTDLYADAPPTSTPSIQIETQECVSELGELLVSLLYNENQHRLTVSVIEARNIKFPDERQDSFVRVTLNQHYRTIKVKRTTTVRGSMEPKFTQGFHFNLTSANIDVTSVSLQLFQPGPGYSKGDKIIGKCVLGSYMFARGKALTHWNTALASPMEQVQQWHTLAE